MSSIHITVIDFTGNSRPHQLKRKAKAICKYVASGNEIMVHLVIKIIAFIVSCVIVKEMSLKKSNNTIIIE